MRVIVTILATLVVLAAAAAGVIYTGAYNVAATDPHHDIVRWAFDTTFKNSVERRSRGIEVPPLDGAELQLQGASHYAGMCAVCHGAPGEPQSDFAKGLLPQPPHLAEDVSDWGPRQLFWIVKHGVKMTGMPAWDPTHSDQDLWAIVAFVDRLPTMSAEEYRRLTEQAPPHTHDDGHAHDGGHDHDSHEHEGGHEHDGHAEDRAHTHDHGDGYKRRP